MAERIVKVSEVICPPGYRFARHVHPSQLHFTLVVSGEGEVSVSGVRNAFAEGDLLWIPAGTPHSFSTSSTFHFAEVRFEQDRGKNCPFTILHLGRIDKEFLYLLFLRIRSLYGEAIQTAEAERVFEAYRLIAERLSHPSTVREVMPVSVKKAVTYIKTNCFQQLRVRQVARSATVSERNLRQLFRRFYGTTPRGYIEGIRMEMAKTMLLEGVKSIKEISYSLGFSSQSHFNQVFRRHQGVAPSAFRAAENVLDHR